MSEQMRHPEISAREAVSRELSRQAYDHLTDGIDPDLAKHVKKLIQTSPDFRETVESIIGGVIEHDWYEKAANIAKDCGLSDEEFKKLAKRFQPNPRLIA